MTADPRLTRTNLDNPVEIVITRTFAARRELVWEAWTDPRHVGAWWGPAGFTTTTHAMEVRPGGSWRYTMHGPDGRDYLNRIDYLEVVRPSRLRYKHGGDVEGEPVRFETLVTFDPTGPDGSHTTVTMRSVFPDARGRDLVIQNYNAVEGGKQHLASLEDHLATMAGGAADDGTLTVTRVVRGSREVVWALWTQRDHLVRWFGPTGAAIPEATLDLRVGGAFHYRMSHPGGMDLWGRWVFREIDSPARLAFVSSFSDARGGIAAAPFPGLEDFPPEVLTTVTLVEHAGIGKGTLVTVTAVPLNATPAQRAFFASFRGSMQQGWSGTMDRLAEAGGAA